MNLLWDCKYYQDMSFSQAEVQELLTTRTLGDIESQLARREDEMRHDLRRRELALSEHSRFMEELRSSESDLGVVELAPARTLSTVLDAGERGGFGADLFSDFVKCTVDDGLHDRRAPSWLAAGANVRFGRLP